MREESAVHRQPGLDGETPISFVTGYDDVVAVLADNERFVLHPTLAHLRLAIAEDDLYWRPISIFRSLAELPVARDPTARRALRSPSSP